MVDRIESMLAVHSRSVVKLTSRDAREAWRGWKHVYPLPRKEPHAILQETVVDRLGAVARGLHGRHAYASYGEQAPAAAYVLMADSLVGWRCQFVSMPPLHELNANMLVAATDLSWSFGIRDWRRGLYGRAVFVRPANL